ELMVLDVFGPAGRLEARLDCNTDSPVAVAVIAPELGGLMNSRVLHNITLGLLRLDCAVLRVNFRGPGTSAGEPTDGRGEVDDYRALLDVAANRFASTPIWAVGYSFGSYVAMGVGAQDQRVGVLVGIGLLVDEYAYEVITESETPKPTFL